MIQRIQSLLLLVAALISLLLLYLPVYELIPVIDSEPGHVVGRRIAITSNPMLLVLNGAIGVFSFFAIFIYRKRMLQMRLCNLLLLLTCILIGLLFFSADTMATNFEQRIQYLFGSYLPLIQVILIFLAARFIKRDEQLVRAADRLR